MQLEQNFTTSATPTVRLESVSGNLSLLGWEEDRVWVRSSSPNLRADQDGNTITIRTDGDCRIQLPIRATVRLESVAGNADITDMLGELSLGSVSGNLRLTNVASAQSNNVSGNLVVREAEGGITARNVSGDVILAEVNGPVVVANCSGSLRAKQLAGDLKVHAGGDIRVWLIAAETHVEGHAGGDIRCRIPADFQAQVRLSCGGDIRVKRLDAPIGRGRRSAEFTLGEGRGELTLRAGGDILLSGPRPEGEDDDDGYIDVDLQEEMAERAGEIVQQVVDQVETQVEALARQLDEKLAALGSGDEIAAKVQLKIQNALRKAEEKIAAATRRAEEQGRAAERRAEEQGRAAERRAERRVMVQHIPVVPRVTPVPPVPPRPVPPRAPSGPSDQERMQILRMLEEGKISVEQAEQLLAALGG